MASYWYRTGTATLTQGSKVVTISGAQLASAGLSAGDMFTRDGGQWYEIERIDGSEITLTSPYAGESEAEAPYAVIRLTFLSTTNAQLAVRLANLLHDWQQRESQLREWHGGTLDGGPNGDGRYPLSDGLGNTHLVPCPAWFGRAGELAYDFEQELDRVLTARDQAVSARDDAVPAAQTAEQAAQATGEDRAAVAGMKQAAETAATTATQQAGIATTKASEAAGSASAAAQSAATAQQMVGELELGTSAKRDVTTSSTDTTSGRVLKVGDFGVGQTIWIPQGANLNDYITPGEYHQSANANANPELNYPAQLAGSLKVVQAASGRVQEYTTYGSTRRKFLRGMYDGVWSSWVEFYHSGNLTLQSLGISSGISSIMLSAGAIVEQGTNANGSYWRWESGLQVCLVKRTSGHWTYPAAFASGPFIFGTATDASVGVIASFKTISNNGVELVTRDTNPPQIRTGHTTSWVALGEWK